MLWKIKKACEREGPVGVTMAFGSGGSLFSVLSTVRLLAITAELSVVALFLPLWPRCPGRTPLSQSTAQKYSPTSINPLSGSNMLTDVQKKILQSIFLDLRTQF